MDKLSARGITVPATQAKRNGPAESDGALASPPVLPPQDAGRGPALHHRRHVGRPGQVEGMMVGFLPGVALRRIVDLRPGEAKTDT